ncbi:MAG: RNase adapter RapZ [Eubacteriales bacterium]|nr:RNase adapter RapZ [Eubacteriales bacterium]
MRLVIVTGMSGAGKTTVLHYLEDADYYCVDNLPIQLMVPFIRIASAGSPDIYSKIALGIDIRSGLTDGEMKDALAFLDQAGMRYEILFLDAGDDVIIRRYKETRRTHPLAGRTGSIEEGICLERQQIRFMRERADYIINTSKLLTRELKKEVVRIFVEDKSYKSLYITVQSFGFKYGIPVDSDLVVDVRFLPNPYYVSELKPLTGNDKPIIDYVLSQKQTGEFLKRYTELLSFLIPNYIAEGKNQLVISVGCTGGRHRSVVLANEIYRILAQNTEYGVRIEHRDIGMDPVTKA